MQRLVKDTAKLTPTDDWLDSLIGSNGRQLINSLSPIFCLGLEKKKITKLRYEKHFCRVTCGAALEMLMFSTL
jgi:hypothetical protein